MPPEPNPDLAVRLLRESDWVRSLARSLVAGDADADDLAQDTMVAALEAHGSRAPRMFRAWLGTVARRKAAERHRRRFVSEGALKDLKERAVTGQTPSFLESDERFALHEDLARAIRKLPTSERDLIMRRHVDQVPPRQLAKELGLTSDQVRKRLTRALGKLRCELDTSERGRAGWSSALLMLASPGARPVSAPLLTVTVMSIAKKLCAAGLLLMAIAVVPGSYFLLSSSAPDVAGITSDQSPLAEDRKGLGLAADLVPIEASPGESLPILVDTPKAKLGRALEPEPDQVRGVVRFADGSPVVGIKLKMYCVEGTAASHVIGSAATGTDGRFAAQIDRSRVTDKIYLRQSSAMRGVATSQLQLSVRSIPADSQEVELTMLGGILAVQIVGPNGAPEAHAALSNTFYAESNGGRRQVGGSSILSGKDAVARIIHSGRGTVLTTAFEHAGGGESKPVELKLAPGTVTAKIPITIDQLYPSSLDLYITDEAGIPVQPVAFNLFLMSGEEMDHGRFFEFNENTHPITISNIRPGDYQIRLREPLQAGATCYQHRAVEELRATVTIGANEAAVEVEPGSGLELEIVGAGSFPGVEVEIRGSDFKWVRHRSNRVLDGEAFVSHNVIHADGKFALSGMPVEGYHVRLVSGPERGVVSEELFVDARPGAVLAFRMKL